MTDVELLPPGPELAWRNRRLIAARGHWPEYAPDVCELIETAHPDWSVGWRSENTIKGFERPAGFYASRRTGRQHMEAPLYGSSGMELVTAIAAQVSACPACGTRFKVPVGSEVPPHPVSDGVDWCTVRCSQVTV